MPPKSAFLPSCLRPIRTSGLIRLGEILDGGYVVSEDALLASDFLVSMGLSTNWEFEKAFVERRKAAGRDSTIHAYDHSVDARLLRIYRLKAIARYGLSRDRKWLINWRMASGFQRFFDGKQAIHFKERVWREDDGAGSVGVKTIMSRIPVASRVFVKMDIEGAEYRIVADLAALSHRIVGLVIEFHDLDILRSNFDALHAQLALDYDVAHVHANNVGGLGPDGFPNILEITYERKGLGHTQASVPSDYPLHGVDKPNCLDLPDFRLEFV